MSVVLGHYKHGEILYLSNDIYMGTMISEFGEYSEGEIELFRQIVRDGDTVIEVGSNIGTHTIPLSKMAGQTGRVLAFEPQLRIYHLLCGSLGANNLGNVIPLNMAVSDVVGTAQVPIIDYDKPGNFGCVPLNKPSPSEFQIRDVAQTTLDSIGDQIPTLRLLKADVEGMETNVLIGAEKLIRRTQPFLYVENDRDDKSEQLIQIMLDLNYRVFWHTPPYILARGTTFDGMVSLNVFGVPSGIEVEIDLKEITDPKDDFLASVHRDDISKRVPPSSQGLALGV